MKLLAPSRAKLLGLAAATASVVALLSAGTASAQALAVVLTPPTATNEVNSTHCVTATVIGLPPAEEVEVVILVTDAVTGEVLVRDSGTTANGIFNSCYQGPPSPRVDRITAFIDENDNLALDPGEPFDEGTKVWIIDTPAAGQTNGGGHIAGVLRKVGFSFVARPADLGFDGHCRVFDPEADIRINCLDVDSLLIIGTHATFTGDATVNDVMTTYTIDVDDLGEPGAGRDTFTIRTESGYLTTGVLENGNVKVRGTL